MANAIDSMVSFSQPAKLSTNEVLSLERRPKLAADLAGDAAAG